MNVLIFIGLAALAYAALVGSMCLYYSIRQLQKRSPGDSLLKLLVSNLMIGQKEGEDLLDAEWKSQTAEQTVFRHIIFLPLAIIGVPIFVYRRWKAKRDRS